MALIFDDGNKGNSAVSQNTWKVCFLTALPASYYANITLAA